MNEQTYTYLDSSFNPDQAYTYTLLLLVNPVYFSFAIVYKKKLLAYQANCALTELTNPDKLKDRLIAEYKKVVVALPSNAFSLVPNHLFNADKVPALAHLLDVKGNEKVMAQVLDSHNAVVYKADDFLIDTVSRYDLKNVVFGPKGWLTAIAQQNIFYNNYIYLNFEDETVEILYFKNEKLRFYNNFNFKSAGDVVYFATLVAHEVKIKPHEATIVMSGNLEDEQEIRKALTDFFAGVINNNIQILDLPPQIEAHQILPLAALMLCESSEVF